MTRGKRNAAALKWRLICDRQMTHMIDKEILSDGPHLRRCTHNRVRAWVDDGHRIQGDDGKTGALRAIDDDGRLIWMVHHSGTHDAYCAACDDPFEAMDLARNARARRKEIRLRWEDVVSLRKLVLLGRLRFPVLLEDTSGGGVSRLSTEWYLRRKGFGRAHRLPAFLVALGTFVNEQAGFALYAAAERNGVLRDMREAKPALQAQEQGT